MRQFKSGATRDDADDKLDFEGFLSPLVLTRYAEYLHKHRTQANGKLRGSDNWQKGIPKDTYMKSKIRHGVTTHLIYDGFSDEDIEDSLCAELFNTMGYLFELLKEKQVEQPEELLVKEAWTDKFSSNEPTIEHVPGKDWQIRLANGKFLGTCCANNNERVYTELVAPWYYQTKEQAEHYLNCYLEILK